MAINPTKISQNQIPNEVDLADLMNLLEKQILLRMNCHHLATIQSFDATDQTATVTINYKKTFFKQDPQTLNYVPFTVDYPIMTDCPVLILSGGSSALTFPITKGDQCLVLFNDRDIDNWFAGSVDGPVATPRLHSFSDAIILVGLHPSLNPIANYDTVRAVLRNGQALVGVGATLIKIANNSTTLNTLLQSLVTNIENLVTQTAALTVTGVTTGGGTSGPPANAATITTIGAALTTLGTQIAGLLE